MEFETLLQFLHIAEQLKCKTRHSYTSSGRHESVAEHSFRMAIFAWLLKDEFKNLDMNKVIAMSLFHDFGEAITGDIPTFEKTNEDEATEAIAVKQILAVLPESQREELTRLFEEMDGQKTKEARLYKALDKMEAVIQHNEAAIETWLPLEYNLQYSYGKKECAFFPYTNELRAFIDRMTDEKINAKK